VILSFLSLASHHTVNSSYLLFCTDKREELKTSDPDLKATDMLKELGCLWKAADADARQPYEDKAAALKLQYAEAIARYKITNPDSVVFAKTPKAAKGKDVSMKKVKKDKSKKKKKKKMEGHMEGAGSDDGDDDEDEDAMMLAAEDAAADAILFPEGDSRGSSKRKAGKKAKASMKLLNSAENSKHIVATTGQPEEEDDDEDEGEGEEDAPRKWGKKARTKAASSSSMTDTASSVALRQKAEAKHNAMREGFRKMYGRKGEDAMMLSTDDDSNAAAAADADADADADTAGTGVPCDFVEGQVYSVSDIMQRQPFLAEGTKSLPEFTYCPITVSPVLPKYESMKCDSANPSSSPPPVGSGAQARGRYCEYLRPYPVKPTLGPHNDAWVPSSSFWYMDKWYRSFPDDDPEYSAFSGLGFPSDGSPVLTESTRKKGELPRCGPLSGSPYPCHRKYIDGRRYMLLYTHRAVALLWGAPNHSQLPMSHALVVDHINNIKWDYRVDHLQFLTSGQNIRKDLPGRQRS
jgi:hypothetical protein